MPNYKKMYLALVDEVTNTIGSLSEVLRMAENIYIESDDDEIGLTDLRDSGNDKEAAE